MATDDPITSVSDPETWKPTAGYEGYDVSDIGRVRSFWKLIPKGNGQRGNQCVLGDTPRILRPGPDLKGYLTVVLRTGTMRWRTCRIHNLVLEAFVGPRPPGMIALHGPDFDKANNRVGNLRWGTYSENSLDFYREQGIDRASRPPIVRIKRRRSSPNAKLMPMHVIDIWNRMVSGEPVRSIAADYGLTVRAIYLIRSRDNWAHVTEGLPPIPERTAR